VDERRAAIVAEARSWVGTPYHHLAGVKGEGVDCAMLLCEVLRTVGLVPADYDPRPYPVQWFLHRSEERFVSQLLERARRTEDPQPGDIAMYRFGRCAAHGAFVVDDELIVHAYRPSGKVELLERRALVHRLDSHWAVL
jgi:cell wall-associated NlpC family hydrolase